MVTKQMNKSITEHVPHRTRWQQTHRSQEETSKRLGKGGGDGGVKRRRIKVCIQDKVLRMRNKMY